MNIHRISLLSALVFLFALAAPAAADEAKARSLINSLGCKGCHQFEGSGGSMGPALDDVGTRLNEDQVREQLLHPKKLNPNSVMPSYAHLSEEDIDALVDFLADRK